MDVAILLGHADIKLNNNMRCFEIELLRLWEAVEYS